MVETTNEEQEGKVEDLIDPNEFRIPSKNLHNHHERCQFYTQPEHLNQVSVVLSSKIFPYRTRGDLIRHALIRHLRYLHDTAARLKKPIPSVMSAVDAIIEVMKEEEFRVELEQVVNRLAQLVSGMLSRGAEVEARKLVMKIKRFVRQMPDGYWRTRYVTEIDERFGYLLDKVERASLLKLATGKEEDE